LGFGGVFVVDLGSGNAPLDDTWKLIGSIDPVAAHYVYLPDTCKDLATYWTSHVWIPFLYKSGKISRQFKQVLVVDFDTLGGLTGMSIGALNSILLTADATIDGGSMVLMPVKVASSTPIDFTSSWENMRLYTEYFSRMTETSMTSLVTKIGAQPPIIWDRRSVILSNSALTRGKTTVSTTSVCEPISIKDTIYEHYREQYETFRVGLSMIKETFFSIQSYTNYQRFSLKLFLITGPILSMVMVILRPFILSTLVFRDPLCLLILFGMFCVLSILVNSVRRIALWRAQRFSVYPTADGSLVTYPLYQIYMESVRIGLSLGGCGFGRMKDDMVRPNLNNHKELYPCPPHPEVDWFTVWKTSDATRLSVLSTAIDSSTPTNRIRSVSDPIKVIV
jgi:hypothetical protein